MCQHIRGEVRMKDSGSYYKGWLMHTEGPTAPERGLSFQKRDGLVWADHTEQGKQHHWLCVWLSTGSLAPGALGISRVPPVVFSLDLVPVLPEAQTEQSTTTKDPPPHTHIVFYYLFKAHLRKSPCNPRQGVLSYLDHLKQTLKLHWNWATIWNDSG